MSDLGSVHPGQTACDGWNFDSSNAAVHVQQFIITGPTNNGFSLD